MSDAGFEEHWEKLVSSPCFKPDFSYFTLEQLKELSRKDWLNWKEEEKQEKNMRVPSRLRSGKLYSRGAFLANGPSPQMWEKYNKAVEKSGGFDVPNFFSGKEMGIIKPQKLDADLIGKLAPFCEASVSRANEKLGTNFEFVKILKANAVLCRGTVYYITFRAKDLLNVVTFRARAHIDLYIKNKREKNLCYWEIKDMAGAKEVVDLVVGYEVEGDLQDVLPVAPGEAMVLDFDWGGVGLGCTCRARGSGCSCASSSK